MTDIVNSAWFVMCNQCPHVTTPDDRQSKHGIDFLRQITVDINDAAETSDGYGSSLHNKASTSDTCTV